MRNFQNLRVWQDSMELVKEVYAFAKQLPPEEKFGLKSQMCRAAVSIPSNIAEGSAKNSDAHLRTYLETSLGSAFELETQLLISERLGMATKESTDKIIAETRVVQRQTQAFINTLQKSK
ncbi:MAG: four helix bundle protein [Bacteroidia bacterium]